ncbi:MAG: hypothetical protein M1816_005934 [Peltula sp. TS41687]|nr:MAG: hypothetical protein M1816_005934 [Peltula sp. TS41687]
MERNELHEIQENLCRDNVKVYRELHVMKVKLRRLQEECQKKDRALETLREASRELIGDNVTIMDPVSEDDDWAEPETSVVNASHMVQTISSVKMEFVRSGNHCLPMIQATTAVRRMMRAHLVALPRERLFWQGGYEVTTARMEDNSWGVAF